MDNTEYREKQRKKTEKIVAEAREIHAEIMQMGSD